MSVLTVRGPGSIKVEGPATIIDAAGNAYSLPEGAAIALCRCGASRNKPFCDSSHKEIGWDEPAAADPERLPPALTPIAPG